MKNLIEIINERLESAKQDYQRCFEEIDYPLSQADKLKGSILTYQDCLNILDQYNLITAPKSIKLSEIVERLNETILGTFHKVVITRFYDDIIVVNKNEHSFFTENIVNINSTNKIVWINDSYMFENNKWLYALWIAGTTVIDDMGDELGCPKGF